MIRYATTLDGITEGMLAGFFVGWPNPPTPALGRPRLPGRATGLQLDAVDPIQIGDAKPAGGGRGNVPGRSTLP